MQKYTKVLIPFIFSTIPTVTAYAGTVPQQAIKNAEAGYCRRALTQIQPLLADHAKDGEVQYRYGQALTCLGKADDAIVALKTAVELDPKNGVYHRALGEAYGAKAQQGFADGSTGIFSMMGLMKTVRGEFQLAAELAPDDVQAHVELAQYYIMVPGILGGSYSKAHDQEAIIDKLDPIQGLQTRADEASNKGDIAAGAALLRQADAQDKSGGSLVALGLLYADGKQYDDAFKAFREAETKDPKAYMAWYQVGKTAGLSKSNYDEGIASLKQYLAFADLPDTLPAAAWAHYRLGKIYEAEGQKDLARGEYAAADSLNADQDSQLTSKLEDAERTLDKATAGK